MQYRKFTADAFPYLHKCGKYAEAINKTRNLAQKIDGVDRDELGDEYLNLSVCAPRRADRGKRYFANHSGVPTSGKNADPESEVILEMALWNEKKSWPLVDGGEFFLLDYQFPLKARRTDQGIGKVDLLGVTNQGRLMVIELKVKPYGENNRGDTPVSAMLQGLRYAAIVQSNLHSIAREMEEKFDCSIQDEPPVVQVLAPENWWLAWRGLEGSTLSKAGNWELAFVDLAEDIEERLGISVECAQLNVKRGQVSFDEDCRPRLNRTPKLQFLNLGPR